ncbi:alpha/beta hydrolase [Duganella aceris]|uniref:Alpha/beta hydrolase n=1 Tax=Duganella aceris TaxID=2703883 RepID=A0ABX0FKT9_9BURK|nr:alpha/beta hydrolase [Duganella aceris]NGZ85139.1 alpha/beta hydrolase [Duganella aceris]
MSLDPELQRVLQAIPSDFEVPIDWPAVRAASKAMEPMLVGAGGPTPVKSVETHRFGGPAGPIEVRVYRPEVAPTMTVVHFHGGGWALGDLDGSDPTVRRICRGLGAIVVSCTYRRAPEHRFPAAYDDALAQARWVLAHIEALGGDPERVVIAGDSAGGNLSAAVTIALRDERRQAIATLQPPLPALRGQLLLYPGVDLRLAAREAPSFLADLDPTLPAPMIGECISAYVGDEHLDDWRASPLAADDLSCLPPAMMVVLTVDPLRDQGVEYAARLHEAGVACEVIEFPHLTHGFSYIAALVPAAATAFDEVLLRFAKFAAIGDGID